MHEKTIYTVMGGIESILGGMHRNKAHEVFSYYDKKYIQPWVLHNDAVNLLQLQYERITMEEQHAKLCGSRVSADQKKVCLDTSSDARQDKDYEIEPILDANQSMTCRQILHTGFYSHPYAVYKNKTTGRNMFQRDALQDLREAMQNAKKRQTY